MSIDKKELRIAELYTGRLAELFNKLNYYQFVATFEYGALVREITTSTDTGDEAYWKEYLSREYGELLVELENTARAAAGSGSASSMLEAADVLIIMNHFVHAKFDCHKELESSLVHFHIFEHMEYTDLSVGAMHELIYTFTTSDTLWVAAYVKILLIFCELFGRVEYVCAVIMKNTLVSCRVTGNRRAKNWSDLSNVTGRHIDEEMAELLSYHISRFPVYKNGLEHLVHNVFEIIVEVEELAKTHLT